MGGVNSRHPFTEVSSAGLGQIPDVDRVEYLDTKQLYEKYGLTNVFSPGPPPHGPRSFRVHFNSADEVVKIEFAQGSYKSVSREKQIMARMTEKYGFEIEEIGVAGLTLEDNQRMIEILQKTPFKGYYETREFEITPITFRKTDLTKHNSPFAKDLVGKTLNGFLVRQSRGPRKSLPNSDLPDYYPDEKIRWSWSFHVFPSEFSKLVSDKTYTMGFVEQFDEPTIEAFKKRKIIRTRWLDAGSEPEIIVDNRDDKSQDPAEQWRDRWENR